jgi:hypothetical protein
MATPINEAPVPEKDVRTHEDLSEKRSERRPSTTVPEPPQIATNPVSNQGFGEADGQYISGYKLYAALFGIVSVFFLVLLDFSITATVSTIVRRITGELYSCRLTTLPPRFRTSGYPIHYQ